MSQILTTTNYDLFSQLTGNRPVDPKHVQKLIQSFEAEPLETIIEVNSNMQILDGQHRFEALRYLNRPICYMIVGDYTPTQVQRLNNVIKSWTLTDYINSYANTGVADYIKLLEIIRRYSQIAPNAIVGFCAVDEKQVKCGQYKLRADVFELCTQIDHIVKLIDISRIRDTKSKIFRAFKSLYSLPSYDAREMERKIMRMPTRFVPCVSTADYIKLLLSIYNYGNKTNFLKLK